MITHTKGLNKRKVIMKTYIENFNFTSFKIIKSAMFKRHHMLNMYNNSK